MSEFQKQFGKQLKFLRSTSGLSQADLAEAVGVTEKTVSYWENGHNAVSFNKIPLLAKALGVPEYKLFVFVDIENDSEAITKLIKTATRKEQLIIAQVIKSILSMDNK